MDISQVSQVLIAVLALLVAVIGLVLRYLSALSRRMDEGFREARVDDH